MKRLTTRSIATAQAIRDREDFKTSGSLRGESHDGYYPHTGLLDRIESDAIRGDHEARLIDYIVWSYSTPIAWHKVDGTWHVVAQKFSPTTTKHQGNLYLAKQAYVDTEGDFDTSPQIETLLVKYGNDN